MNKLKSISIFDRAIILLLLLFLISLLFVSKESKYKGNETKICGYINYLDIDEDKAVIEISAKEKIIAYYYGKDKFDNSYNLGDNICIYGIISKAKNNKIFNLFNYRKYLLSKNIYYTFKIQKIDKISDNNKFIYKLRNIIRNKILTCKNSYPYLLAFILGDNQKISNEVINNYRKIGVSHLFAISGMHISFISAFIVLVLNMFFKSKKTKTIILICIMILICNIFVISPSIIRSLSLFVCLSIDKLFKLKQKPIKYLIIILLFNLIINRYAIYNIGFLFSYLICFFLLLYQERLRLVNGKLKKSFIISLISFLVSIPILINNFFCINLLTPFFNLIIIPYVSVFLFPLSFICLIFPFLDNLYYFLITILENVTAFFASINMFQISLKAISPIIIILYYFYIIITINFLFNKKIKYLILLLIALFIHHNIRYLDLKERLYMIDVGQGDSMLLTLKNNANILIDTGGRVAFYEGNNKDSMALKELIPFFWSIGVNQIDYLILTHGDYDHMGEAINLVNNFKVDKVIFNCGTYNELEQELINVLDKKKIPYYSCIKELNIDDNKLYFLNNNDYGNENDNSSVIYTELNNHKFLFMGDAGVGVEQDLIEKYNLQDIDVLKVGHHGSKTSSSELFIDEINPKYSIISVGKNNRYGHPNDSVLDNLENSKIYRTDKDGSIMFKIKSNKLQIKNCVP